jgi:hypothetical protein
MMNGSFHNNISLQIMFNCKKNEEKNFSSKLTENFFSRISIFAFFESSFFDQTDFFFFLDHIYFLKCLVKMTNQLERRLAEIWTI